MLTTRSSNRRTSPGGTGRRPQTRRRLWRFLSILAVLIVALAVTADRPLAQFGLPSVIVDTDRWMDQLFNQKPAALETALGRFVLPGSHDAGTYQLLRVPACEGCNNSWRFVDTKAGCEAAVGPELICDDVDEVVDLFGYQWGQTQHLSIAGQLRSGARVFDLRFFRATAADVTRSGGVLTEGVYYIHHGLAGPTLTTVLNDFVDFLADPAHSREVVILNFRFLMEGTDVMGPATLDDFYNRVRANLGRYMAPAIDPNCANDPSCLPTQRFGAAASVGELLAQGHQVIVSGPANGTDVWSNEGADPSYDAGYPVPDDATHPWRSDAEIQTMLEELSSTRGNDPTKLFVLGVHVGLDDDGLAIWRSILCPYDPANVGGLCPAVNSDWDEFLSLADVANYTNPKALGALVRMRRDRINAVVADHFDPSFTYEAFKLNGGATRVETIIKSVTELDFHDSLSGPDYFPSFRYPTSYPLPWQVRAQRNIMEQDVPSSGPGGAAQVLPNWPGWKSFPNTDASALISLQIFDAEPAGANSPSAINDRNAPEGEFTRRNDIPIAACLSDFSQCQRAANLLFTEGSGSDSSRVTYTINSCVWSWLNGESVQPSSVCNEPQPSVGIWGASVQEGDSGTQQLRYPIRLSNPFAEPVTVSYGYAIATADTSDYVQAGGSVTFQPGETLKYATVDVKGDLAIEPDETLTLQLITPSNASEMPGFEKAVGTILNDDTDVAMSIADLTQVEGTGGAAATQFLFHVALNPAPTQQISVRFDVTALTATSGADFLPLANGLLRFAPGESARDIRVDVVPDVSVEPDEQFTVTLSNPVGAYLASASATGTIVNDDHPGTLSLPSNQTATEGAGQLFSLGTFDDPRAAGPWTLVVNWADGTTEQVTLNAPGPLSRSHVYADNGQYFVSAQVLDRDQVSGGTVRFFIDVANVAPTAVFAAPGPAPEGTPVTFTLSGATDQSLVDRQAGFRYAFACGAGSLATATWANSSAAASVDCTFDDNATPGTVRARVIDKDDGFTEYTLTPQVRNVAPTAALASNGPVPEGSAAIITFSNPADPSTADTAAGFHYAFACNGAPLGLSTYAASAAQPTASCVFDQDGLNTVRARIIDKDGGFSEYMTDVTVTNVAPTATLSNNGPIVEGSSATITFSNPFDPSAGDTAAGFRYAFSCTGGALTAFTYANSSTQPSTTCAYSNDGIRTVTARIIDRDGGVTDYSTPVTVNDQPPVVQPPAGVQSAPEGSAFRFSLGTIVDPGLDGPYTVTVSWSDGGAADIFTASAGPISAVHTFSDNRSRFATVIATDRNGVASARVNVDVTITNVSPTLTASVSVSPVAEGGTTTVTGTIADPGVLDSFNLTVTWGDGSSNTYPLAAGATSYTASHAYLDDNPTATPSDVAAVHVAIVDKDGGSDSADVTAQVTNVDPVLTSLALEDPTGAALGGFVQALSGLPVDLSASFADVGILDTHAATINWGDGTSSAGTLTESAGAGTLTAGHSWKVPGTYTVSLTVADDDSGWATRDVPVTVVDGAGAACAIEAPVRTLLATLQPGSEAAEEVEELLDAIIGRHDGEAENGACDQLQRRRYTAGVRKLVRAVAEIEELIAEGGLTASQVQTLRDIETRLVLVARWTYNSQVPQEMDRPKLRRAAALAQRAEQATLANQPLVAIDYWWQALRLLKPEDN